MLWTLDICSLTCWLGRNTHFKSRHPFIPAAQQPISSSDDDNNRSAATSVWRTLRLHTFIPDIGIHPPRMALPRTAWVWLNHLRINVRRFCSSLHIWGRAPSMACVAQKNKPLNISSSVVQSILMQCMACWFWTMRQSNGCSTPCPEI